MNKTEELNYPENLIGQEQMIGSKMTSTAKKKRDYH